VQKQPPQISPVGQSASVRQEQQMHPAQYSPAGQCSSAWQSQEQKHPSGVQKVPSGQAPQSQGTQTHSWQPNPSGQSPSAAHAHGRQVHGSGSPRPWEQKLPSGQSKLESHSQQSQPTQTPLPGQSVSAAQAQQVPIA